MNTMSAENSNLSLVEFASGERDYCMYIPYVDSMFGSIFILHASVFAAQASAERDCCISMRYVVAGCLWLRVSGVCVFV